MSDVEDLLIRTLRDPARALPAPADPVTAIRGRVRAQRRTAVLGAVAAVLVVVAAALSPVLLGRTEALPPASGAGLLDWAPRGPLAGDTGLAADAERAWREHAGPVPAEVPDLLWAGPVDGIPVVLLQAHDTAGTPRVAEVAGRGADAALVRSDPITDVEMPALRLVRPGPANPAETLLLTRPDSAGFVGSGDPSVRYPLAPRVPADGLVTVELDLGGRTVWVPLARGDGATLTGSVRADGALPVVRPVRLVAATWGRGAVVRRPAQGDDRDGPYLAQALGGTDPITLSVLYTEAYPDVRTPLGVTNPRLYEVRRDGRTWIGQAVYAGATAGPPQCVRVQEVTGRVERIDALVLRCPLPELGGGVYTVLLARGVRLTGIHLAAGTGPGERDLDRSFPRPVAGSVVDVLGPEFPTGAGRLTLVDAAGKPLPDVRIPAYS